MNWRWWAAHVELSIGVGAVVLAPLLVIAEPTPFGGWPGPWVWLLRLAAMLGLIVGFGWMLRIYRGREEPAPPWRYRDRR